MENFTDTYRSFLCPALEHTAAELMKWYISPYMKVYLTRKGRAETSIVQYSTK